MKIKVLITEEITVKDRNTTSKQNLYTLLVLNSPFDYEKSKRIILHKANRNKKTINFMNSLHLEFSYDTIKEFNKKPNFKSDIINVTY